MVASSDCDEHEGHQSPTTNFYFTLPFPQEIRQQQFCQEILKSSSHYIVVLPPPGKYLLTDNINQNNHFPRKTQPSINSIKNSSDSRSATLSSHYLHFTESLHPATSHHLAESSFLTKHRSFSRSIIKTGILCHIRLESISFGFKIHHRGGKLLLPACVSSSRSTDSLISEAF